MPLGASWWARSWQGNKKQASPRAAFPHLELSPSRHPFQWWEVSCSVHRRRFTQSWWSLTRGRGQNPSYKTIQAIKEHASLLCGFASVLPHAARQYRVYWGIVPADQHMEKRRDFLLLSSSSPYGKVLLTVMTAQHVCYEVLILII